MTRGRTRLVGALVVLICAAALSISVVALASNLAERNVHTARLVGKLSPTEFVYQGHRGAIDHVAPDRLEAELGAVAGGVPNAEEYGVLRISWRGDELLWPVGGPVNEYIPDLEKYQSWLKAMLIVDGAADEVALREKWTPDESGSAEVVPRLVVAARYPAPGYDEESWGLVRRRDWVYRIAELATEPDANQPIIEHERTYEELEALVNPNYYTAKYRPERMPASEEARIADLWMHEAMVNVTPPSQYRGRTKAIDEVIESMGWPWITAIGSAAGLVVGVIVLASTTVRRVEFDDADE